MNGSLRTFFVYYQEQDDGKFIFPSEILTFHEVLEHTVKSLVFEDFYSSLKAINMLGYDDELQKALPNAKILRSNLLFEVF